MYGEVSVRHCSRYSRIGFQKCFSIKAHGELTVRRKSKCNPLGERRGGSKKGKEGKKGKKTQVFAFCPLCLFCFLPAPKKLDSKICQVINAAIH